MWPVEAIKTEKVSYPCGKESLSMFRVQSVDVQNMKGHEVNDDYSSKGVLHTQTRHHLYFKLGGGV